MFVSDSGLVYNTKCPPFGWDGTMGHHVLQAALYEMSLKCFAASLLCYVAILEQLDFTSN
jgi:hypothetical protein